MSNKHRLIKFVGKYLPLPMANPDVVAGIGALTNIAEIAKKYGATKPLIVTDAVLVEQGLVKMATDSLDAAGMPYAIFAKVTPNPHSELCDEGVAIYKAEACHGIIAFGGGSPMDCAKIIGAMIANPKPIEKYHGMGQVKNAIPPFIAVPTTAGTASETSPGAVITLAAKQKKIVIADKVLIPKVAILDPKVLVGLPPAVTAATGMDALTHAVESFLSVWRQPATRKMSLQAVEKIFKNLAECCQNGANLAARQEMLEASFCAGRAFSRASLGYVHGIAHQFGGMFHTPHGVANAMVLPHILDAYAKDASPEIVDLFTELCFAAGLATRYKDYTETEKVALMHLFISGVRDLSQAVKIPTCVPEMRKDDVPVVVARALRESHGEDVASDPGFPSPKILTSADLTKVVSTLLPPSEQQQSRL